MTPKNDRAQQEALEALVAASLRCPDKLPEITEGAIKRFVEQKVTLNTEDEAALAKSKPGLMQQIGDILKGKAKPDEDCVRGSATQRHAKVPIPASLMLLAKRENLSACQTHQLLNMRLEIKAHRSNSQSEELEDFDWERFFNKVKEYLK